MDSSPNPQPKILTLVVPVFQEEGNLKRFLKELADNLEGLKQWAYRVLFVVDPGSDQTEKILFELATRDPRVAVILMSRRFGHQACLMEGLKFCGDSDVVITIDGDSQHPASLIPELLRQHEKGFEIVNTFREPDKTHPSARIRASLGTAFYRMINRLSDTPVPFESADFRLLSRKAVDSILLFREQDVFVRGLVGWIGFKQVSVGYKAAPRIAGESKYKLAESIAFGFRAVLLQTSAPLRLVWWILGLSLLSTTLVSIWTLSQYFLQPLLPEGWTTVVILMMATFSIQLLVLGIMSSYIGYITNQVKGRPRAIVAASQGVKGQHKGVH
jgi:dolichol-phosphate mannosyltransferase